MQWWQNKININSLRDAGSNDDSAVLAESTDTLNKVKSEFQEEIKAAGLNCDKIFELTLFYVY
jgi:hypothetical protein